VAGVLAALPLRLESALRQGTPVSEPLLSRFEAELSALLERAGEELQQ
jgi:hypothetical protein